MEGWVGGGGRRREQDGDEWAGRVGVNVEDGRGVAQRLPFSGLLSCHIMRFLPLIHFLIAPFSFVSFTSPYC